MSDNVIKLVPNEVGENFKFDSDVILEEAKNKAFTSVVVIGELPEPDEDGATLWVSSAVNAGEALILLERAKYLIVHGKQP